LEELISSHFIQDFVELESVDEQQFPESELDDSDVLRVELSEYVCSEDEQEEDDEDEQEEDLFMDEEQEEELEVLLQLSLQEEPSLIPVTEIKEQESLFSQL
jgi:hypothetical protein